MLTHHLQGWPKEFVMGCENFRNLCVVIGGTIGGEGGLRFLPLPLSSCIICNGVSLFHRPFNEHDQYRSGIVARRIDGRNSRKEGRQLYSLLLFLWRGPFFPATSSSPSQPERLTSVDWRRGISEPKWHLIQSHNMCAPTQVKQSDRHIGHVQM